VIWVRASALMCVWWCVVVCGGGGGGGGTARFCALGFLVLRSGDRLRLPLVWLWLLDRRVPPLLRLCSLRRSLERDRDRRRVGCQPPANVLGQVSAAGRGNA
jgi:hypothetical protein